MVTKPEKLDGIKALTSEMMDVVDTGEVVTTELATSERIIARVTDGIYREPWAAFRELISNAYDADATRVIVETGAPDFTQVVVRDNGIGMSPGTVAYIMKSIGGSSKRTNLGAGLNTSSDISPDISPAGRPLIGKIGIGLFAVAQLTQHFQIITKAAGELVRTSATIKLKTHDELKRVEAEDGYLAGTVAMSLETVEEDDIDDHGTSVVLYSLRPEISRTLQSIDRWTVLTDSESTEGKSVKEKPIFHIGVMPNRIKDYEKGVESCLPWDKSDEPNTKFSKLVTAAAKVSKKTSDLKNLDHFDNYLKLLWQLSLALPLKYPANHPFDFDGSSGLIFVHAKPNSKAADIVKLKSDEKVRDRFNLEANNISNDLPFTVILDGVELYRPIDLPTNLRRASRLKAPMLYVDRVEEAFEEKHLKRAGGQLSFEAYLYWNSQIVPKETSGVLIRVREASGTLFDRKFLDYQVSEQNRLSQITAEIFVNEGLDGAINIDRESFNYSHPHYLYIQKWLHRALRLFISRNKSLAKKDLDEEKLKVKIQSKKETIEKAISIWDKERGVESDPPIIETDMDLADDVGGTPIEWPDETRFKDDTKASAVAIVLEAYGVLGHLDSKNRAALIKDILRVLDEHA